MKNKPIRCAIYTRKSTHEGLDQAFNSLDAQREAGEAYITSHKHEGWSIIPTMYNDGGYSGGNMDRPARYSNASHAKWFFRSPPVSKIVQISSWI